MMIGEPVSCKSSAPRLDSVPRVRVLVGCMRFSHTRACCCNLASNRRAAEPPDLLSNPRIEHSKRLRSGSRVGHVFTGPLLRGDEEEDDDDDDDLWLLFWISYRLRARADSVSESTRTALLLKSPRVKLDVFKLLPSLERQKTLYELSAR
ncbi:unnamed protein product [Leuciscus chuanchicus]